MKTLALLLLGLQASVMAAPKPEYLVFPPQEMAPPVRLADVSSQTRLQLVFNGETALAQWSDAFRLGAGNSLVASPTEVVTGFISEQTFAVDSGPLGNVTLYLAGATGGPHWLNSLWGLPLFPNAAPVTISRGRIGPATSPAVTPLPDGYAAAWLEDRGLGNSVYAMRYDAQARPVWPQPVLVKTNTLLRTPAIAWGGGTLAVAWLDSGGVRMNRLDPNGTLLGTQFTVDAHGTDEFRALRLTYVNDRFLAVWREGFCTFSWITFSGEQGTGTATPVGVAMNINTAPQVSGNGSNTALLTGRDATKAVRAALVGQNHPTDGTNFPSPLSSTGSLENISPSSAWSPASGSWLVAWGAKYTAGGDVQVEARRIGPNMEFLEPTPFIIDYGTGPRGGTIEKIAVSPCSDGWCVCYSLHDGSTFPTPVGTYFRKVSATGQVGPECSLNTLYTTEILVAAAGPEQGLLVAGETETTRSSFTLLFPQEQLPTPQLTQTPTGGCQMTWLTTPHFPANGSVQVSTDLKSWAPANTAQTTTLPNGQACATVTAGPGRMFMRLEAVK